MYFTPLVIFIFSTTVFAHREFGSSPWFDDSELVWKNKEERMRDYNMWLRSKIGEERREQAESYPLPLLYRHRPQKQFSYEKPLVPPGPSSSFAYSPTDERFFAPDAPQRPQLTEPPEFYDESATTSKRTEEDENRIEEPDYLQESQVVKSRLIDFDDDKEKIFITALIAGSSAAGLAALGLIVYGFVRLQKKAKAAADVEYPAYGVTGPNKDSTPTGDRRLAHSAQVYHYQLTKQQIIAMESNRGPERRGSISDADSDDDNEEGDYTVYECPGLAPTGEMEVKNPLFQDDPTPATGAENDQDSQPPKTNQ